MTDPRHLALLRDAGNTVVPQYFDVSTGRFRPVAMEPDEVDSINVRNTTLLKASGGAILTYQYLDKTGVWISYNPRDGANPTPILSYVRSVNMLLPDNTGNVTVPIPDTEYTFIDVIPPTAPESDYPYGTSAFITYFERATMTDWAAVFDNEDIPDGEMMVVTHRRNNINDYCVQLVDMFKDGRFDAQFSRSWDYDNDGWTPLERITYVQSINGIEPDVSGNIELPYASETVRGIIRVINETSAMIPGAALDAVQGTYLQNDIDVLRVAYNEHVELKSSSSTLGHVKVDGTTITVDSDGVISAVGGGSGTPGPQGPPGDPGEAGSKWFVSETEPVGGTTSDFWLNSINHFVYTFDGTNWTQTNTNLRGATWFKGSENPPYSLGHIADFYLNTTTYDIFQKHILSWTLIGNIKGSDGDPLQIVDSFGVYDSDKALSVNMGSELNDFAQNLYTSLIAHMDLKASSTDLGHVKVDGSTISIDANGVISANSASGFKIDNNILPIQAPSTYDVGVTISYIPVGHANNSAWLVFYGGYYANSIHASTFKMNFVVTTVKDATDKTTQTVKMYGNIPKTNFELTTATRTSNDDSDTWMSPLATMPIQRNSGTPSAWKNALAGTLYYDHSGKGWYYKKFDGDNDISNVDWAPLVPSVLNVTDSPAPPSGEDFVYSAESVKEMFDTHEAKKASYDDYGHVKVDGTTITAIDGVISATMVPGPQGVIIPSESRQIKMWTGTTTVSGGNGDWTIDYASAGFTEIRSIQITLESGITAAADKPLGGYVSTKSLTAASGKAYKVSSAGLLAAMQQVFADNGVTVNVLIIGH